MDDVQAGKMAQEEGISEEVALEGHQAQVESAQVLAGGSSLIRMTWKAVQVGVREVGTAKHGHITGDSSLGV